MRRLFMISFLVIFALLLCSCVAESDESSPSLPKSESSLSSSGEQELYYSTIDPESEFALSSVEFAEKYFKDFYAGCKDVESYEIPLIEVDMDLTNMYINWYFNTGLYDNDILLNNFLVLKTVHKIIYDQNEDCYTFVDYNYYGTAEVEWHFFVVYDPDDICGRGEKVNYSDWKHTDTTLTTPYVNYYT